LKPGHAAETHLISERDRGEFLKSGEDKNRRTAWISLRKSKKEKKTMFTGKKEGWGKDATIMMNKYLSLTKGKKWEVKRETGRMQQKNGDLGGGIKRSQLKKVEQILGH